MRPLTATAMALAMLAGTGCGGSAHRAQSRHGPSAADSALTAGPGCSTGRHPSNEVVVCAQAVDTVNTARRPGAGPLRVQLIDVITALQQTAAHYPSRSQAVGSSCSPPARGNGVGQPWPCQVSYQSSPAITLDYRVIVHANGCWSATPVAASRGVHRIAPRYTAC